jgi:hypothetical protein
LLSASADSLLLMARLFVDYSLIEQRLLTVALLYLTCFFVSLV